MDVTFTTQSAGRANVVTGNFTSDSTEVTVMVGFTPRYIRLVNATDGIAWEWMEGMPEDASVNIGTELTIDTSGAVDVGDKYFKLSAGAAGNGKDFFFVAM